jgi:hypothetical protein
MINIITKKNRIWNRSSPNRNILNLIPNQPEISTKRLTQTIDTDSVKKRIKELTGHSTIPACEGMSNALKSA